MLNVMVILFFPAQIDSAKLVKLVAISFWKFGLLDTQSSWATLMFGFSTPNFTFISMHIFQISDVTIVLGMKPIK